MSFLTDDESILFALCHMERFSNWLHEKLLGETVCRYI